VKEGSGVLTFVDGSMYKGMFKNNKMCGEGIYWFSSRGVYQGSFENREWMGVE
jgi:hypothetical protein